MTRRRLVIDSRNQVSFFLLVEDGTVTIGGHDNPAEAVLENLRVCRVRCELEVEGDSIAIRKDAEAQELQPGVVVLTAVSDLCLEPGPFDSAADSAGLVPDAPGAAPEPAALAAVATKPVPKRLLVVDGADQGRAFALLEGGTMTIGKDRRFADITLNDLYLGRTHCDLKIDGDRITVVEEDGGRSSGGTFINGKKINRQELHLGDVLRVGNSHLRLEAATGAPGRGQGGSCRCGRRGGGRGGSARGERSRRGLARGRSRAGPKFARGAGTAGPPRRPGVRAFPVEQAAGPGPGRRGLSCAGRQERQEHPGGGPQGAAAAVPPGRAGTAALRQGDQGDAAAAPPQPGDAVRGGQDRRVHLDRPGTD